jgi:hypothetical protein
MTPVKKDKESEIRTLPNISYMHAFISLPEAAKNVVVLTFLPSRSRLFILKETSLWRAGPVSVLQNNPNCHFDFDYHCKSYSITVSYHCKST